MSVDEEQLNNMEYEISEEQLNYHHEISQEQLNHHDGMSEEQLNYHDEMSQEQLNDHFEMSQEQLNLNKPFSLFAYPAEDNFAGVKYPLEWIQKVQKGHLNPVSPYQWNDT